MTHVGPRLEPHHPQSAHHQHFQDQYPRRRYPPLPSPPQLHPLVTSLLEGAPRRRRSRRLERGAPPLLRRAVELRETRGFHATKLQALTAWRQGRHATDDG